MGAVARHQDAIYIGPDKEACLKRLEQVFSGREKGVALKIYLENFKVFNDTFGYENGGRMIAAIIDFLQSQPGCEVYRLTGVEFILLLHGASHAKGMETAREILDRFDSPFRLGELDCLIAVNAGMALYPGVVDSAEELLSCLDNATVESAHLGQNQLAVFDSELREKIERRFHIINTIPVALAEDRFEIQYQPIYHSGEKRFVRAQCRMRLLSPELGPVGAQEFLPIAENSGQICAIDAYAIEKTCALIRKLLDSGKQFESIAVGISPVQLLQENFPDQVRGWLETYGIPQGKLAFEISISPLVSAFQSVYGLMDELSEMGVELVLDEYGSGYSSLDSIPTLPVDTLKLERMFIWQLETNPTSGHVIHGLVDIAHNLGLRLIAEGVETQNQVQLLEQYGCRYYQGFYYSPPVEGSELMELFGK